MPNRYKRDELIRIALDMAVVPNLRAHDIRDGAVMPDAHSINWLQDIIDFWYHMVPFSASVEKVSLNATANSDRILLPTDFILDVRDGYITRIVPDDANSMRRRVRLTLQKFISVQLASQGMTGVNHPNYYTVIGKKQNETQATLKITPTPSISTVGEIWYYQLPPVLTANGIPGFPSDYVIVEYLHIRALEWNGLYEPGTASKFCDKIVAGMKANGLMNEPEDDEIPFDPLVFNRNTRTRTSWMGNR